MDSIFNKGQKKFIYVYVFSYVCVAWRNMERNTEFANICYLVELGLITSKRDWGREKGEMS